VRPYKSKPCINDAHILNDVMGTVAYLGGLPLPLSAVRNFYDGIFAVLLIFLADRTNGRAYATVLRLSSVVCLSVCL